LAVHKLIVFGERPVSERAKATKDLLQAASIASYFLANGQADVFNAAWRDAIGRGKGWRTRAEQGRKAMLRIAPDVADDSLWA
ncbi:MAG: GSU2403 family nucleotidyltransferase fold protein, partial [Gammaproteobacteria bacterium]|nr:GSU2403 family nucleotidyltransferase fold protein [Gammaproteobacteria bacterium]